MTEYREGWSRLQKLPLRMNRPSVLCLHTYSKFESVMRLVHSIQIAHKQLPSQNLVSEDVFWRACRVTAVDFNRLPGQELQNESG